MLEDAIAKMKAGDLAEPADAHDWAPQINLGVPVLIPEGYVPDLDVRLGLYRRLSDLHGKVELEGFAAELIDRFGKLPPEVDTLLEDRAHQDAVQTGRDRPARWRAKGRDDPVPQ
jgi:transcription-repair coupling factor (superfamily II helicase)